MERSYSVQLYKRSSRSIDAAKSRCTKSFNDSLVSVRLKYANNPAKSVVPPFSDLEQAKFYILTIYIKPDLYQNPTLMRCNLQLT